jgi:activator of HSP90 ATPase
MNHAIHQEVDYDVSPGAIYDVLTHASKFSQMTGGAPAEIDAQNGGAFSLFGGMIVGVNVECVPGERLVQAWRAGNWDPGVYSMVRFELTTNGDGTKVALDHTGYPDGEAEHLSAGWTSNYWDGLRNVLSS